MNNVSLILESNTTSRAKSLTDIFKEAESIERAYFATGTNSAVDALANATSQATVSTKLTKAQVQNFIGLCAQIKNFFNGAAVTQGDYLNTVENMINGSASGLSQAVSNNLESLGERMVALSKKLLFEYSECVENERVYNSSQLGSAVNAVQDHIIVFGSSTSKSKLLAGITLQAQVAKMLSNQAVVAAEYKTTLALWTDGE